VDLNDGDSVAIANEPESTTHITRGEPPTQASTKVRTAQRFVIPPRCEAHVTVQTAASELCLIQNRIRAGPGQGLSLANGVAEIRPHVPFKVRVINTSHRERVLPKGMILGAALPHPPQVISIAGDATEHADHQQKTPRPSEGEVDVSEETPTLADQVNLGHLNEDEKGAVLRMLEPHKEMWDGHLGTVTATQHRIQLTPGAQPVHAQPYRAGTRARAAEREEIQKMLAQDVIEPATCEWASPIVLVPKPDGSLRFCVDYRRLNAITVPDTYPLPRMDECIDSLGEAVVFTTLDCNSGYWQIPVDPADREKTAFTSHFGVYQFRRLPFGLRNAPGTFQRAIDIILSGIKWKTCLVYLDDVIIFSSSRKMHLQHVNEALNLLGGAGLSLKLSKCHFFQEAVDYLGHVIRPGKLSVAEKNTAALRNAPLPRTQTELRSFLGLCNVYRRFVPRFAAVAAPLTGLLGKGTPPQLGTLSPQQINAFNTLRDKLLSPPVLALPRTTGKLWLDTDASDGQLGTCLLQEQPDGKTLPLGYWSRTLNPAERNYSTTEKECLAIVWAVTHLRPYLEGTPFTVRTDHHALRWVMNLSDAQGRLARWRLRLAEFDFKVEYNPGASHHAADALSRLPHQPVPPHPIDLDIPVLALDEDTPSPIEEIPIVMAESLYEHQCRDQLARSIRERTVMDPTWDYDTNGIFAQRLPSGELHVHVPPSLSRHGPCSIATPIAEDGSNLRRGDSVANCENLAHCTSTLAITASKAPRLLTRLPSPDRSTGPRIGLGVFATDKLPHAPVQRIPSGREDDVSALSTADLLAEQAEDPECQRFRATASRNGLYDLDDRGVLIRIAPSDGSRQIVVPLALRSKVLYLEHYPKTVAHPGAHRMFQTMRRSFYWPHMAEDVYETVRQCDACARNRISERRHTNRLQLFPAKGPLESVAMDILGPLPRTKHGNRFLLVIADRYTKVTRTVPLRTVTALSVARAFVDHWAYVYGPPVSLLTDNGPQFTAKFFQAACAELGIDKVFTTAYHPQTNGQVERYNRTILAALRAYVAKRQDDWDDYTSAVTFAYNCRVHSSLGMPPFELVLSRPPLTLSLQARPRQEEITPRGAKQEFLERLKTLRIRAGGNLHTAQARYKADFDKRVRPKNSEVKEGDEVFLRVEVTEVGRNHKLESLVQGPYQVLENAGTTFRLRIGGDDIRVSSDRVTPAPRRESPSTEEVQPPPMGVGSPGEAFPDTPAVATRAEPRPLRQKKKVRFNLPLPSREARESPVADRTPNEAEFVIDKLVDFGESADGNRLYRVRWLGYEVRDDTWEPEINLPAQFIRRYWKNKERASRH
jgi:transposase InsO family protein